MRPLRRFSGCPDPHELIHHLKEEQAMCTDSKVSIDKINEKLSKPATTKERVRELFKEWWERRIGWAVVEGEYGDEQWVFPVKAIERIGTIGAPIPHFGFLHFPKDKLLGQTDRILRGKSARPVDDRILQAAGRVMLFTSPHSDNNLLKENLKYMLCSILGDDCEKSSWFVGLAGGLLDSMGCDVAHRITYALGKTAKTYCSRQFDDIDHEELWDKLTNTYLQAKAEGKGIDWSQYQDEEEATYYQRTQNWADWMASQKAKAKKTEPDRDNSLGNWTVFQGDSTNNGQCAEEDLTDINTTAEQVQALFDRWWEKRTSLVLKEDGFYMFNVWYESGGIFGSFIHSFLPHYSLLHFQESKLREDQIALLERSMRPWLEEH